MKVKYAKENRFMGLKLFQLNSLGVSQSEFHTISYIQSHNINVDKTNKK